METRYIWDDYCDKNPDRCDCQDCRNYKGVKKMVELTANERRHRAAVRVSDMDCRSFLHGGPLPELGAVISTAFGQYVVRAQNYGGDGWINCAPIKRVQELVLLQYEKENAEKPVKNEPQYPDPSRYGVQREQFECVTEEDLAEEELAMVYGTDEETW